MTGENHIDVAADQRDFRLAGSRKWHLGKRGAALLRQDAQCHAAIAAQSVLTDADVGTSGLDRCHQVLQRGVWTVGAHD
ncbi:hypothetical protein G6F50_016552 [Rhizopus delemar]|uniref:Uncharacterized protein n=1 Tax=Rhizopus delemar TaxID=936053 RepID=A0A9P6XSM6_9FUNG|nr:hypothetical protein G6F50_016552 [Rhizopus delemar]